MSDRSNSIAFQLGTIFAFAEMVALDVKRLAFSLPFSPKEYDRLAQDAKKIAKEQGVHIRLDKDLLTTDLFSEEYTRARWVFLIYRHPEVLREYLDLKTEKARLVKHQEYKGQRRKAIAQRIGRLLSYKRAAIEDRLRKSKKAEYGGV
jgi:hypothetical protein